jgi:serine protease Do
MENGRQFRINLYTRVVGDTVTIEAQRADQRFSLKVAVADREDDTGRLTDLISQQSAVRRLGILALDLTPRVAALLPQLRRKTGVVVATVSSATPFSQQGRLQPGDVIYALNGKVIENVGSLNTIVEAVDQGRPSVLLVERQGTLMYLAFRMEWK